MISWVPSAELAPLASRHLVPLRIAPSACTDQFCAADPLQVSNCTAVPSAVAPPVTSMHLPSDWKVLPVRVHCWFAPPWQVHSWSLAPSVEVAPLTSMHLPPIPVIWPAPPPVDVPKLKASRSNR